MFVQYKKFARQGLGMKQSLYELIYRSFPAPDISNDALLELSSVHGVQFEIIKAIFERYAQSMYRRRIWKFESRQQPPFALYTNFLRQWESENAPDIIVRMSKAMFEVPPGYLARLIVKGFAEEYNGRATFSCNLDDLDSPAQNSPSPQRASLKAAQLYREPSCIPHAGLAENVKHCHLVDNHCSPAMDELRNRIGKEYEEKLNAFLDSLGVTYMDETGMRKMGYAKTPDAVLLEPIAIDGMIVKWIESKAWFGDPPSHSSYLKDQYWPYYNRFGPGVVIYWFGFVEEAAASHIDKGVLVLDGFPDASRITRLKSNFEESVKLVKPQE